MIKIRWGTPAQHYILHDYPGGVAEIPEEEIKARADFAERQANKWVEDANKIALEQDGLERFAFGMEQAQVWQKQATVLRDLL